MFRAQIRTYKVSNGENIPFEQLIREISKADIIFTGEVHNSEWHHRLQLETVRGLSEAGFPVAVGFEMFPKKSQATLDGWVAGSVSLDDFKRFYETHWDQPWPLFPGPVPLRQRPRYPASSAEHTPRDQPKGKTSRILIPLRTKS